MKVLVVYDSFFGNTEKVAKAIGQVLEAKFEVAVHKAGEVPAESLEDIDYLFVGSPTRAAGPSAGAKKFIKSLSRKAMKGVKGVAFDTRNDVSEIKNKVFRALFHSLGYAAGKLTRKLRGKGIEICLKPAGFFVIGAEGPFKEGELQRAEEWIRQLP